MKKGTRQCPSNDVKLCILSEIRKVRSNGRRFEPVVAEFTPVMHQYRHVFTVPPFQLRVGIDVYDRDLEMKKTLQPAQGLDHFVAQVAVRAAVDGQ
jgi:hypothetical protein